MVLEVYKHCCDNELKHIIEKKKLQQKYEREEKERLVKEEAQNLRRIEEKKQAQISSLVNNILEQSNSWYKHKQLLNILMNLINISIVALMSKRYAY
jgi:hypothetical protein